jgi:hypothetical protein
MFFVTLILSLKGEAGKIGGKDNNIFVHRGAGGKPEWTIIIDSNYGHVLNSHYTYNILVGRYLK